MLVYTKSHVYYGAVCLEKTLPPFDFCRFKS